MKPLPSVALVILNWNGRNYLQQFLPLVLSARPDNCRVIVADNASTDDSMLVLQASFPEVEIIQLDRNYGFAGGYNEALKQVEADYYVLLNSDVEVTPGWLEPLIRLLESNAAYAACQPKILTYHQRDRFEYAGGAGGWIDSLGYPFAKGRVFEVCEQDGGQYDAPAPIFWASGAALVVRSSVYRELDGFDAFFFAHQEEIDLCWRMQLAGYKILCNPESVVYHVGGGTLPRGNSRKTFLNFRNNGIMLARNLPLNEVWWKLPLRFFLDLLSAGKALVSGDTGFFKAVLKAELHLFIWLLRGPKKKVLTRKPLRELDGVYRGSIVWQYFVKKKRAFSSIVEKKEAHFF